MKEIDFIPEWYKADRKRKRRYVRQSTLMAVMIVIMMGWGFVLDGYLARVSAQVQAIEAAVTKGQIRIEQTMDLQNEIELMKQKTALLDKVTPRTKMAAILAEVSYLTQDKIVLSRLALENEPIEQARKKQPQDVSAVVQIGSRQETREDPVVPECPSRVVVSLTGIAAKPSDAAMLIARLEESRYFDGVALVFSKPKSFKDKDVTEFKIRCHVADYAIEG
jgi:hypothetical protein